MCVARCITHHDCSYTCVEPSPQLWVENTCAYFQKISRRNQCTCMGVYRLELVMDPVQLTSCMLNSDTEHCIFHSCQCWHLDIAPPIIWDCVESYAMHISWPVGWDLICLPKTKLIIFKQRVSSSVLPPLAEEAPLFVFKSTYIAERLGHGCLVCQSLCHCWNLLTSTLSSSAIPLQFEKTCPCCILFSFAMDRRQSEHFLVNFSLWLWRKRIAMLSPLKASSRGPI